MSPMRYAVVVQTKTCPKCSVEKTAEEFGGNTRKKDGLQSNCKTCRSSYHKEWYKNNTELHKKRVARVPSKQVPRPERLFLYQYLLSHPCVECGESRPECLEFDHIDPATKLANVSQMSGGSKSMQALVDEVAKCQVLCANCHSLRTAEQFGWYKGIRKHLA